MTYSDFISTIEWLWLFLGVSGSFMSIWLYLHARAQTALSLETPGNGRVRILAWALRFNEVLRFCMSLVLIAVASFAISAVHPTSAPSPSSIPNVLLLTLFPLVYDIQSAALIVAYLRIDRYGGGRVDPVWEQTQDEADAAREEKRTANDAARELRKDGFDEAREEQHRDRNS